MKNTGVEARRLEIDASPWYFGQPIPADEPSAWEYPLVRVTTDEGIDGHSMGYGANGEGRPHGHRTREPHGPLLRESIWQDIRRRNRHLYAHTDTVLGILDVALWDIAGQACGLPIASMLGISRAKAPAPRV